MPISSMLVGQIIGSGLSLAEQLAIYYPNLRHFTTRACETMQRAAMGLLAAHSGPLAFRVTTAAKYRTIDREHDVTASSALGLSNKFWVGGSRFSTLPNRPGLRYSPKRLRAFFASSWPWSAALLYHLTASR